MELKGKTIVELYRLDKTITDIKLALGLSSFFMSIFIYSKMNLVQSDELKIITLFVVSFLIYKFFLFFIEKREVFKIRKQAEEFINGDEELLELKLLSKLANSKVTSYAISRDFSQIACSCNKKMVFLKMRKYLKETDDIKLLEYSKRFNIKGVKK
jgi:hypothetical protein